MNSPRRLVVLAYLVVSLQPLAARAQESVNFERDIAPIFEERCLYCHGEDEPESGLQLDSRAVLLRGGDSGLPAVVPGKSAKSYLMDVISHRDPDVMMPPDEEKMPEAEIEIIARWIDEGAEWPGQMDVTLDSEVKHWAFQPLLENFHHSKIDSFLDEKLDAVGLTFSPPASARDLIRRASIVLTGLAPTPERTQAFVQAFSQDADDAYERLVDELLQSPHFGERWAQHWLDVIRWAETNGSESNMYRKNAWMYRDYVVRAFNEDKPYDEFVREQLAGDTLQAGDATGFLVAGPHVPAGTVGFEPTAIRQARADRMDEILQTVGASMMGVTVGCARCHNHKFDPLTITDYYAMSAVFQDVEFGGRFPELAEEHPRVIREKKLRAELESLRAQMLSQGWGWIEDWQGYQEIRFPAKTTTRLRLNFDARWVMADELEIFEANGNRRNMALAKFGTKIVENPATLQDGKPAAKLVNGVFGTKQWLAKSAKGNPSKPWLEFLFTEEVSVDTIRISTNRADFLETDYLEGMNRVSYGDFRVALPDDEAGWRTFCATTSMKKRVEEDENRKQLQQKIQSIINEIQIHGRQPAFLARFIEPVETFVLARGSPESPRNKVEPAAPAMFNGALSLDQNSPGAVRRKAFADWLVDESNPLTARVMVNRLWHHTFGKGIVATPSDFGKAGASPSHPELLDWLALEFIKPSDTSATSMSMKRVIKMLVLSRAFRQSSLPSEKGIKVDASSQLLWRFPPRRLEAEVIRDSILLASGKLDDTIGGPSYRIHNVKKRYAQWQVIDNHGENTWRRMLYQERMRRVDDRIFTAFDFPDCGQIRAKRPVSTTPLQALNLMNSEFVVEQSELLARRAQRERGPDLKAQVVRCFELLHSREPSELELSAGVEFADEFGLALLCRTLMNTNEFAFLP